jgi:hypothetical protein
MALVLLAFLFIPFLYCSACLALNELTSPPSREILREIDLALIEADFIRWIAAS